MQQPKSARVVLAIALFSFIGVTSLTLYGYVFNVVDLFWDLDIYVRAARDGLTGGAPYREVDGLAFVYHPLVLHLFMTIERIVPLSTVLTAFYVVTSGWLGYELIRTAQNIVRNRGISLSYWVLLPVLVTMIPVHAGVFVIVTGNLTTYLHFFLIAYLLRIYRNRGAFSSVGSMIAVGVFSLIKPYFLAYILLALVNPRSVRSAVTEISAGVAVFAAFWFGGALVYPAEMDIFMSNIAGLQSNGRVDVGINIYGLTQSLGLSKIGGLGVQVVASALLILVFWAISRRIRNTEGGGALVLTLAYLVLTLVNPRLKEYDLFPAVLPALVFWHIYSRKVYALFVVVTPWFLAMILLRYYIVFTNI